jgi:hypothetical protein
MQEVLLAVAIEETPLATARCIKVEYDKNFSGGDYSGVGQMMYLPVDFIEAADGDVGCAFEKVTKIDCRHIVYFNLDEIYDIHGKPREEVFDEAETESPGSPAP